MARKRVTFFRAIQIFFLKSVGKIKKQSTQLFIILFVTVWVSLVAINVQAQLTYVTPPSTIRLVYRPEGGVTHKIYGKVSVIAQQQRDANAWEKLARESYKAGKFEEAVKYWQQAISAYEVQGDWLNQAISLSNLSLTYQQLGRWQEAEEAIKNSLKLLPEESRVNSPAELKAIAQILDIQGNLQWEQGQVNSALKTWQESANIHVKLKDELGWKRNLIAQVKAMQELGFYEQACQALIPVMGLENQGNFTIPKQSCQQLTDNSNKVKENEVKEPKAKEPLLSEQLEKLKSVNYNLNTLQLTGVRLMGDVLRKLGYLDKSLNLLEEVKTLIDRQQLPEEKALVWLSLGNIYESLGNRNELLSNSDASNSETNGKRDYYLDALNSYQEAVKITEIPQIKIQAQLNLFSLLVNEKTKNVDAQDAKDLYLAIVSELSKLPPSRQKVYAEVSLMKSLYSQRKDKELKDIPNESWQEIIELGEQAVKLANNLDDDRATAYALGNLGKIYVQKKQWLEAQKFTEKALLLSQNAKQNWPDLTYQWQSQLGRILWQREKTDIKGAIAAYTAAFNTLQSVRNDLVPISRDGQFDFRDEIEPVYRELVDLLLQGDKEPSQANLKQARKVIEALQVAELDNFFREACIEIRDINIDNLDDKESAVIYPIILKDSLDVIVKFPGLDTLKHYRTNVGSDIVNDTLVKIRKEIVEPDKPKIKPLNGLLQNIYTLLLKPAETDLAKSQVKTLVFVLDGALRNIPMAALYDGQKYLIESYSLALAPGLKLIDPKQLNFSNSKALIAGISKARQEFPALPNVEKELEEIQSQVSSIVLFNDKFTDLALQDQINSQSSRIVHLATHGVFSSNAENTFIITWDERININDLNQLLQNRDKQQSKPIELLVLSACQTAAGDNRATLGLAGVAVKAGARSTLASLWNIGDDSTAVLMKEFYRQLLINKQTKAEALRQAQLFLLKDPKYNTPAAWSPYILVGNWL